VALADTRDRLSNMSNNGLPAFPSSSVGLFWQHQRWGTVSNWQVQDGLVQSMAPIAPPDNNPQWQLVGIADRNQDGPIDLLWRNQQTGQNQWDLGRLGNNVSAIGSSLLPTVADGQWQVAAVQDFNQDGIADIFWRHQGSGENRLWLMDDSQVKLSVELPDLPDLQWQFAGVADFNRDGSIDLLWRHQTLGENVLWLMNGFEAGQNLPILRLDDRAWTIAGVTDMNQDGQADILWRHDTGLNVAWLMQGATYQSVMPLLTVSDPDWQLASIAPAPVANAPMANAPVANDPIVGTPGVNAAANRNPPIDLSVRQLTVPPTPIKPGEAVSVAVEVTASPVNVTSPMNLATMASTIGSPIGTNPVNSSNRDPVAITEPIKLSFFLSADADISRTDRWLDAVMIDPIANPLNNSVLSTRSLQLPGLQDEFWRPWADRSTALTSPPAYIGVLIEALDPPPEENRVNNQQAQPIAVTLPNLVEYDFVYHYDGASRSGDFYQGAVVAYDGTYSLNQIVDPIADINQSQQNGVYSITARRAANPVNQLALGALTLGTVTVTEYYDSETKTRYRPVKPIGQNGLGSESGYIRSAQSNTDRFGYDYYEADVWLTRPVDPVVSKAPRSTDLIVRSLINPFLNYWDTSQNGGIITYSFYKDNQTPYYGNEKVSALNDRVQQNVRQVLSNLESQLNVRFVEVTETATDWGVIRYLASEGEGGPFYAYTYYPGATIGGDVHLNTNYAADLSNGFGALPGSYGYRSIVHETLHALGLKHPGNYDAGSGSGSPPYLYPEGDNSTNTIMSYNVVGYSPMTPMDYDLIALQYLYGGRSYRPGATNYRFASLSSYWVGGELNGVRSPSVKQLLWDAGGQDTLDFANLTTSANNRFDLRPGGILTARSAYNTQSYTDPTGRNSFFTSDSGVKLADGTLIEHIVNSPGNDYVIANQAANRFLGYRLGVAVGSDAIELANGNDVVVLENYRWSDLKVSIDQNDLVINLAGDGTIRLLDYMSLLNPVRIRVGRDDYRYSASRGWQLLPPKPIVEPTVKLATGVSAIEVGVQSDQLIGAASDGPSHSLRCSCPSCDRALPRATASLDAALSQYI
jgi:hypothetical protein